MEGVELQQHGPPALSSHSGTAPGEGKRIGEFKKLWFQATCVNVLMMESDSKHVAFIMAGNRQLAQKRNVNRAKGELMAVENLQEN